MSNSLQRHGLQHTRLPCPSLSLRVCSNSCPLSWWCHPTISSSITPFSSCPQSFPASGSFPVSWPLASGGPRVGTSDLFPYWLLAVLGVHCCAWAFSLWQAGANLPCSVGASHCSVFSCCEAQALDLRASVVAACGLRRSGARAWLLHGMWALPGPGIKPVSLAL